MVAVRTDLPNDIAERVTIDLGIDRTERFFPKSISFGFFGSASENPELFWLFMLRPDGTISYSHDPDSPDDTDHHINLVGKKVSQNEVFTLTWNDDEEFTYRIASVLNLNEVYP